MLPSHLAVRVRKHPGEDLTKPLQLHTTETTGTVILLSLLTTDSFYVQTE